MDFFQLLSDVEKADPEFLDRISPRRKVFKHLSNTGKKITAAAAPAILASFFTKAYGQTTGTTPALTADVIAVLNLALSLEYLEYYFYDTALNVTGLINSADRPAIEIIRNDEAGHIATLRGALGSNAIANPGRNAFDYSGGSGSGNGPLASALLPGAANQAAFYGAAQSFSDTGMRAYKGGAPVLNTAATKDLLEAALNIHSVEARHNSHFRTVRRGLNASINGAAAATSLAVLPYDVAPKSWISLDGGGLVDGRGPKAPDGSHPAEAVYGPGAPDAKLPGIDFPAESNTTQATKNLTAAPFTYTATQVSEAFDEPLDAATVKSIASKFVTPASGLFK
jgi:hypothetical protein